MKANRSTFSQSHGSSGSMTSPSLRTVSMAPPCHRSLRLWMQYRPPDQGCLYRRYHDSVATPRERTEEIERQVLSPRASLAAATKGREREEPHDDLRTVFQRDRDRIVHAKAFRRLKHKTQVFLAPEGDHYRVRLTHTLDVSQIARTAARALRLNEDLAEAIALGHDLGHTPFGHLGEQALTPFLGRPFRHSEQCLRVVDHLENDGDGLNLTWEVRDGIVNHPWSMPPPSTLEAQVVRFADRIAYLNHDVDDALRAGVLTRGELPAGPLRCSVPRTRRADQHAGDRPRRRERGPARGAAVPSRCSPRSTSCATSCSSRSTSREAREGEHERATRLIRELFQLLPRASRRSMPARVPSGAGGPADPRRRLHRRHDGPVRPADVRAALPSPGLAARPGAGSTGGGQDQAGGHRGGQGADRHRPARLAVPHAEEGRARLDVGPVPVPPGEDGRRSACRRPSRSSTASAAARAATPSRSSASSSTCRTSRRSSGWRSRPASRSGTRATRRPSAARRSAANALYQGERGGRGAVRADAARRPRGGGRARLRRRSAGSSPERSRRFGIGYAPGYPDFLLRRLRRGSRARDPARGRPRHARRGRRRSATGSAGRITFPIHDLQGRDIGFGARILPSDPRAGEQAKYLNTAETPIYRKNEILYNLHRARAAIAR